ncbi:Wzz/FepE/Etk N-terminal domain-containing protein [Pseudomonas sp. S1_E04]
MSSSFRAPPAQSSKEVDVSVFFDGVWRHKKLIVLITAGVGLLATAYAFLATPEFEVSSVLRPSAINELDALNRSEVYKLPPGEALTRVGAALESYDTRLGFFRSNQKLFKAFEQPGRTLEQGFEEFNRNSINLTLPDSKSSALSAYIKIGMSYPAGIDGVAILNGFVDYAIATERDQIAADMTVIVKNRLREIEGKLSAARSSYDVEKEAKIATLNESDTLRRAQLQDELKALRNQLKTLRSDRVAQLNEAIGIAKALGIKKPSTPSSFGDPDHSVSGSVMRTEVNSQQVPLYFLGVDALEAEKNALMQRKSDDFTESRIAQIAKELQLLRANREIEVLKFRQKDDLFLAGVQPLRAEEARLRNLNIDMSRLNLVAIDRRALEPTQPIRPQKFKIILFGVIFGVMASCLYFSLLHLFREWKQRAVTGVGR